jgi:hypothetical protein
VSQCGHNNVFKIPIPARGQKLPSANPSYLGGWDWETHGDWEGESSGSLQNWLDEYTFRRYIIQPRPAKLLSLPPDWLGSQECTTKPDSYVYLIFDYQTVYTPTWLVPFIFDLHFEKCGLWNTTLTLKGKRRRYVMLHCTLIHELSWITLNFSNFKQSFRSTETSNKHLCHSFWGPGPWEQCSWAVPAQGLSFKLSWKTELYITFFYSLWWYWGLSSGLRTCQTGHLPLGPLLQPKGHLLSIFPWLLAKVFRSSSWGLVTFCHFCPQRGKVFENNSGSNRSTILLAICCWPHRPPLVQCMWALRWSSLAVTLDMATTYTISPKTRWPTSLLFYGRCSESFNISSP